MVNKVDVGALALALCIFFDSTAMGFQYYFGDAELQTNGINPSTVNANEPFAENKEHLSSSENDGEEQEVVYERNGDLLKGGTMVPGGPDQPEVKGFTPIGTSDMVDPFTGDFSYNIPLMDIDGYPMNIAYSSGVTMDQEASWVGLGWSLNPGVINRSMRGLPDEYDGTEQIEKEFNMADNWTVGGSLGFDGELFGFGDEVTPQNSSGDNDTLLSGSVSINASLGLNYNNYAGYSASFSLGLGASNSSGNEDGSGSGWNAGLGFSGSSTGGATVSPSFSFSRTNLRKNGNGMITKGVNIGTSVNSRGGLVNASVGYSRVSPMDMADKRKYGICDDKKVSLPNKLPIKSSYNFGMSTFTPHISMPMKTGGFTFSFKLGGDVIGYDPSGTLTGFYNKTGLKTNQKSISAYGYMNLAAAQSNRDAMLDFNRENDGPFTKNTPALPIPNATYDIYSISGQGIGGSYRPKRNDIGYVFDPEMKTNSLDGSLGLEVNLGGTFKGGVDVSATYSNSKSGAWDGSSNGMADVLEYNNDNFYFREANELAVDADPAHFAAIGGNAPLHYEVSSFRKVKPRLMHAPGQAFSSNLDNTSLNKSGTDRRNQVLYTMSNLDLNRGLGIQELHDDAYANGLNAVDHHPGQFTVLNVEGSRYVYGIAAYSHFQEIVSFAVEGSDINSNCTLSFSPNEVNPSKNLVDYEPGVDNSIANSNGTDNHFNSVRTPHFAHSYLLTSVLDADYIDADNIQGPSEGDLGGYLSFDYKKIDNYQWRNPVNENKATFNEGMHTDRTDDKGNYIYGKKELWYVETIKSKNHVAKFYTSNRDDGYGVQDENGGLSSIKCMQKLDKIELYSLPEYNADPAAAVPLKVVHFEYDYELCSNYAQNSANSATNSGKLTLQKIYFTYEKSNKGMYSPYSFDYGNNPDYDMTAMDRWGNYKESPAYTGLVASDPLRNSDFPYVGFDQAASDYAASAWLMDVINLPSGGRIEVDYESDDYAFVQHKKAQNMLKIVGIESVDDHTIQTDETTSHLLGIGSNSNETNMKVYFELVPHPDGGYYDNIDDYVKAGDKVYFRALMEFGECNYDFVPGYAEVAGSNLEIVAHPTLPGVKIGCLPFEGAKLKDAGTAKYNPIAVAGIQFGRLRLSNFIPPANQSPLNDGAGLTELANALGGAFTSFGELIDGPNVALWNKKVGTKIVLNHSWVRLNNPNQKKLGGGARVRQITMHDAWEEMTNQPLAGYHYGQQYAYTTIDGKSSGVAAYEPQLGNDENPWRQPIANDKEILLAPDVRNYQETPFGEQFFPSPRVGYSRVTVRDLQRQAVERTATGSVVHEFYTAKDFPTIVKRTETALKRFKPPVFALFFSAMIDEMAVSQGFVIETNDMHGKQKSQSVYAQGQTEPISRVSYKYLSEPMVFDGVSAFHLTNTVTTIDSDGEEGQRTIGLTYEAVGDFRKSTSNKISGSIGGNLNFTAPVLVVPTITGSGSYERTAFRSATFTKVIERFGLMAKTMAEDLGSKVETNNLAYDAETGTVLLTQTATNFNDAVYNFTYPAHWYYDQMGQAYKNIGKSSQNAIGSLPPLSFVDGGVGLVNNGRFTRGDELKITFDATNFGLGWVVDANSSGIRVLLKNGEPLEGLVANIEVIRSGRRNLQTTPVGSITLRTNPLNQIEGNVFDKVLQAGAVEYSDDWRTFCECFLDPVESNYTTNPYVLGTRGSWRPKASYVHLSGRKQTYEDGNSNIREDGLFTSFTPFYKLRNNSWEIDRQNWTYTSSVVEFSPFGQALETIDALDRYSSSMYGYNQSLAVAVAANTRYRQLGYDGFEDYDYINCSDNHFRLGTDAYISDAYAHTGRKSVVVKAGSPVVFSNVFNEDCEDAPCMSSSVSRETNETGDLFQSIVSPQGGVAPYQIDYEVLQGTPNIQLNGAQLIVSNTNQEQIQLTITITDANGCIEIIHL